MAQKSGLFEIFTPNEIQAIDEMTTPASPELPPLGDGRNLPLRAEGEFEGYSWEFRGDIVGDSADDWTEFRGPRGIESDSGGGGVLPFADLGWKACRHIGSFGFSYDDWSPKGVKGSGYRPATVKGVVSAEVPKVLVRFKDGEDAEAQLLESGRADVRFFFLIHNAKREWTQVFALDAQGSQLDRVERPELPSKPR